MAYESLQEYSIWALRGDCDADWRESLSNRTVFELCDAAFILSGVQPDYPQSISRSRLSDIENWTRILKENLSQLLTPNGYNGENYRFHRLSHERLRAWCRNSRIMWPIPENTTTCSKADIEALRRELEQERAAREAAEAEATDLRLQLATAGTAGTAGQDSAGLTFPYATKQLAAARAAALEYWCDFDPERPPLQKRVAGFMVERGVPTRQAQELAIAIKPDDPQKS